MPVIELDIQVAAFDKGVIVNGTALRDGSPIALPLSFWPVVIVNPPTMVPDGLGGYRDDPDEAIREAVRHAVEAAAV